MSELGTWFQLKNYNRLDVRLFILLDNVHPRILVYVRKASTVKIRPVSYPDSYSCKNVRFIRFHQVWLYLIVTDVSTHLVWNCLIMVCGVKRCACVSDWTRKRVRICHLKLQAKKWHRFPTSEPMIHFMHGQWVAG